MTLCWTRNPRGRPTFLEIIDFLLSELEKPEKLLSVSFYAKSKKEAKPPATKEISCTTPLKSESETLSYFDEEDADNEVVKNDHPVINFFPTTLDVLNIVKNEMPSTELQLSNGTNESQIKTSENGTAKPKQSNSSDEFRDNKISNGSLPHYNTTIC